ncbi:MAG: hypothetical protein K2Y37_01915 [Pirellulales bacterium]|nr:hypothetical protein [Pirellulales bacterium]
MEYFALLCPLFLVALVAVVIFDRLKQRQLQRELPRARYVQQATFCPRCGSQLVGGTCLVCAPHAIQGGDQRRALQSLVSQIEALQRAGQLAPEISGRLLASLQTELAGLGAVDPAAEPSPLTEFVAERTQARGTQSTPLRPTVEPAAPRPGAPPARRVPPRLPTARPESAPSSPFEQAAAALTGTSARVPSAESEVAIAPTGLQPDAQPAPAPPTPRARLGDLLAAFMEEKNVRWGELVGGLLIVGCSIALVISFWSQIAERDLLRFGLFNGIVAALFGLGYYTSRKWKLPTTSRGVLVIATLLVPLNFLSVAAVTRQSATTSPEVIAGEVVSVALFSTLVFFAGRLLVAGSAAALVAGVLGPSILQLFVKRFVTPESTGLPLYAVAGAALACHGGAVAWLLGRMRKLTELSEADINALLRILGITAFAAAAPCGLLLALSGSAADTLERLAPLVTLAGVPALASGLFLWRRLAQSEFTGLRTAGTSIALVGMGVMLGGAALAWPQPAMLIVVAAIIFVVLSFVAQVYAMPAAHVPAAVALTIGYLFGVHVVRGDLDWLTPSQNAALRALASAVTGNALAVPAVLYGGLAALCSWRRRHELAGYFVAIAAALAAASLLLVTAFGFRVVGDTYGATYVYAIYSIGAIAGAVALARSLARLPASQEAVSNPGLGATAGLPSSAKFDTALLDELAVPPGAGSSPGLKLLPKSLPVVVASAGAILAALAIVQGLVYLPDVSIGLATGWTAAALAHAIAMLAVAAGLRVVDRKAGAAGSEGDASPAPLAAVIQAIESAALLAAQAALALLVCETFGWFTPAASFGHRACHALALALVWLTAAALRRSSVLFAAGQATLFAAAAYTAVLVASQQAWFDVTPSVLFDPRMVQHWALAWGALCFAWLAARLAVSRVPAIARTSAASAAARLLNPPLPAVDHLACGVIVAVLLALAAYAALPGVAQELALERGVQQLAQSAPQFVEQLPHGRVVPRVTFFELNDVPHAPAQGVGTWILLIAVGAVLIAGLWERVNSWRILGLLTTGAALMPLIGAWWEPQVAAASALRWSAAAYFLVGSIGIWSRATIARLGQRLRWPIDDTPAASNTGLQQFLKKLTPDQSASLVTAALMFLCATPLVAMGAQVAMAALHQTPLDQGLVDWTGMLAIVFAVALVIATGLILEGRGARGNSNGNERSLAAWTNPVAALALVLGAAPLVAVSIYIIATALSQNPIIGPDPSAVFRQMGGALDFSLPAVLVSLVLVGYAVRERSAAFAFAAGLATNTSATIAYSFTVGGALAARDPALWTELAQLNALVAAVYGLAWLGAVSATFRNYAAKLLANLATVPAGPLKTHPLQAVQAAVALVPCLCALGFATAVLFWDPRSPATWLPSAASPLALAAVAASLVLALAALGRDARIAIALVAVALWCGGSLASLLAVRWDQGDALALHVLLAARGVAPWLLIAAAWQYFTRSSFKTDIDPTSGATASSSSSAVSVPPLLGKPAVAPSLGFETASLSQLTLLDPRRRAVTLWATLSLLPALVVALRSVLVNDPQEPWWSTAGVGSAALVAVALATWSCRRWYLYAASALLLLMTSIWFPRTAYWNTLPGSSQLLAFIHANLLAIALPVVAWLVIELKRVRPAWEVIGSDWGLGAHRPAVWLALLAEALLTLIALVGDYFGEPMPSITPLGRAALAATLIGSAALLWDRRAREAGFFLYTLGLVIAGQLVDSLDLAGDRLLWTGAVLLGAYTLAASYLWSRRAGVAALAKRSGIPLPDHLADREWLASDAATSTPWIVVVTSLLAAIDIVLVYWVELVCPEAALRTSAAQAAVVQAFALGMLARGSRQLGSANVDSSESPDLLALRQMPLSAALQQAALLTGTLGLVAVAWSWVEPTTQHGVLARSVATCVALVATNILYGLLFAKLPWRVGDWPQAARRFMPLAVVALLTTVLAVLGQEAWHFYAFREVPLAWPGILAIALARIIHGM